jgi:hypothetical protein
MVQVKVGRETGDAGSDLKIMGYDVQVLTTRNISQFEGLIYRPLLSRALF